MASDLKTTTLITAKVRERSSSTARSGKKMMLANCRQFSNCEVHVPWAPDPIVNEAMTSIRSISRVIMAVTQL